MTPPSEAQGCTVRSSQKYLFFRVNTEAGGRSHSPIGRIGGSQNVSINSGVTSSFIVAHEIGHALGLFHEHTRHDCDSLVTVQNANILSGFYRPSSSRVEETPARVPAQQTKSLRHDYKDDSCDRAVL